MPTESTEERKLRLYREGIAQYQSDDIWAAEARARAVAACGLCDERRLPRHERLRPHGPLRCGSARHSQGA